MKTWEMIKVLSENPNKVFVRVGDDNRKFKVSSKIENGKVIDYYVSAFFDHSESILLNDEWELVREPIDFMTAIKAYDAGKVIKVRTNDFDRTYKNGYTLIDNHEQPLTTDEILNGKWYIED